MRNKTALVLLVVAVAVAVSVIVLLKPSGSRTPSHVAGLPIAVTLRQVDGGPHYYADIDPASAWMDEHIMVGAWLEQPQTATEVGFDVAIGNNIYWNLAGNPLDTKDCGGVQPCRVNFNVIRAADMHASAPDVTSESGSETVAYEGTDEPDLNFGPGSSGWNHTSCVPSGSQCGYTVANFFYSGRPASDGSPGYPAGKKPIIQGFGKGVLFWETDTQAAKFLSYSDTLSADSYWMTDTNLDVPSQGGCALLPDSTTACDGGNGSGLTTAQRALPANYAFNVTRLEHIQAVNGSSKPITVDVETGCPFVNSNSCITPAASTAAAWHAIIAGARGIIWFQHNFGGPCVDFNTFYDGSSPASPLYSCQQTPGVTLHDVVANVSAFNHEIASLNSVLLSPFAEHYVSTGNADVSAMAKYSHGVFYVFAASGQPGTPPSDNQSVTFTVADGYSGPVRVIGENRILQAVDGAFTDKFANENSVHIYQIGK